MDDFDALGVNLLALSQEDDDVAGFRKLGQTMPDLPFRAVGDLDRRSLPQLARTTAYYLDSAGRVRQVFPMETYRRASLDAILNEIRRLRAMGNGEVREAKAPGHTED